ncbi:MAG: oligoendopeptidase F [Pirellulales bacterium]|nr:oligoendopeptidase F [Pirellulales bacterium]
MSKQKTLPLRSQVKTANTWDLASLFPNDAAWEKAFRQWEKQIAKYPLFRGTLGQHAKQLAACLRFDSQIDRMAEKVGIYAFLKSAEDQANSTYQRMVGQYQIVASRQNQAASFIHPEILAIPSETMTCFLAAKEIRPYHLMIERLLRYKPHTLSDKEERLLAMQSEMASTANKVFRQLTDADLKFGTVRDEHGDDVELSNATFTRFLYSPKRAVRRKAFFQFYHQFARHENCLAATLAGSIQTDIYYARARCFDSALAQALFADHVPQIVYDNLITAVRAKLPALYHYYDLRRRKMRLRDIHHYDTYVPILAELDVQLSWKQATRIILDALQPLGHSYCATLEKGFSGRWCDRYPNRGKQSGAFSCGSYDGDPYILMNYQPEVFDHVFTLAHEAGHSMHSYYSAKHQPYEYYDYVIFVAEVASTFNEQLLSRHLMAKAKTSQERAYLINRDIDAIRGTIIRQTMFAEFEKITHAMCEAGEPLTVDTFKSEYHKLLADYFGPDFFLDDELKLECFRIPHFYRAFYVYKYATGLAAAIALADRVLAGGKPELDDYLAFLQSGCSKYPLDLLRAAGVDMEQREPVLTALQHFEDLVGELGDLL